MLRQACITDRQADRQRDKQTYIQSDRQTNRQTDKQTYIQSDRQQTNKQTKQTDRQTDQKDRQIRKTYRQTERLMRCLKMIMIFILHLNCIAIADETSRRIQKKEKERDKTVLKINTLFLLS